MIRILQIVSSLNINAGAMSVMMNYYRQIDRSQVQFDFLYFFQTEPNHEKEILSLGGRCFYLGKFGISMQYRKAMDRFFREHGCDYTAIHCHPIFASELFGRYARKYGIRHVIAHSHSTKYSEKRLSALRNRVLTMFIDLFATDYMACSQDAGRLFGKKISGSGRIFILRNAIDTGKYKFNADARKCIRKELGIPENTFVILQVARFSEEKNHHFMLDVFRALSETRSDTKLVLTGDGRLKQACEAYSRMLGVEDKVIFTGRRQDVPALLSAADVFVLPSLFEGFPVSAMEAQASGLPCLLSDAITREAGIAHAVFLPVDQGSQSWVDALLSVDLQHNREEAASMIRKAGFDIHDAAEQLSAYYLSLE
jgi:glycosyltransferase involved in cell wall biosynthesis